MVRTVTDFTELADIYPTVGDYTASLPTTPTHPVEVYVKFSKPLLASGVELTPAIGVNQVTGLMANDPPLLTPPTLTTWTPGVGYTPVLYSGETVLMIDGGTYSPAPSRTMFEFLKQRATYSAAYYAVAPTDLEFVVQNAFNINGGNGDLYAFDGQAHKPAYWWLGIRPSAGFPAGYTFVDNWGSAPGYRNLDYNGPATSAYTQNVCVGIMNAGVANKTVANILPTDIIWGFIQKGDTVQICINGLVYTTVTLPSASTPARVYMQSQNEFIAGSSITFTALEDIVSKWNTIIVRNAVTDVIVHSSNPSDIHLAPMTNCVIGFRNEADYTPTYGSNGHEISIILQANGSEAPEEGSMKGYYYPTPTSSFWENMYNVQEVNS